jgi:hypothetical protein
MVSYFIGLRRNEDILFVSRITVKMIRLVRKMNITDFGDETTLCLVSVVH